MIYSLAELPPGAAVMVDANIVIYALFPQTALHLVCKELLARGTRQELSLHLPVHVAGDVIHKAMVLEAVERGVVPKAAPAVAYLKQHPHLVGQFTRYKTVLRDLTTARINILPLSYRDLHTSKEYRDNYGLLVNDSLILAAMKREKMHYLATNDADFSRIPGIAVHQPA